MGHLIGLLILSLLAGLSLFSMARQRGWKETLGVTAYAVVLSLLIMVAAVLLVNGDLSILISTWEKIFRAN